LDTLVKLDKEKLEAIEKEDYDKAKIIKARVIELKTKTLYDILNNVSTNERRQIDFNNNVFNNVIQRDQRNDTGKDKDMNLNSNEEQKQHTQVDQEENFIVSKKKSNKKS